MKYLYAMEFGHDEKIVRKPDMVKKTDLFIVLETLSVAPFSKAF